MPTKKPTLYLIDGAGYYFRAYFAIRSLSNSRGLPTNAVYGFAMMLKKILKDRNPDYVVMTLDAKEKTFRHEMYEPYKAHRPQMPEDLALQLPYIDKLIDGFNLATMRLPGWEADDIIGTIAKKAVENGFDVTIVSSDKDLMQLVEPGVKIFDSMKDKEIGPDEVVEKFGAPPDKVIDVLGLMGDSSDNIPGVPGVGPKTALQLVNEYGDMEKVLAAADGMKKKKLRENLIKFADQARLSKKLATVALDVPVNFAPESWKYLDPDPAKLRELFTELEFPSLLKELEPQKPKLPRDYIAVLDEKTFGDMVKEMRESGGFAFDTETTSKYPMLARLVGMSFSCKEGKAYYLPLRHGCEGDPCQLPESLVLPEIKKLLEDPAIKKYGQNIKYDAIVMSHEGITIHPIGFDTMIASYLANPSGRHNLSTLALEQLGETMIEFSDVCGSGAKQITFDKVPIKEATDYAAEDADITYRLVDIFRTKVESEGLKELMDQVETPLIEVLARIERNGVLVDKDKLAELSITIGDDIKWLEENIYKEVGTEFNINSPKQLGEILFENLKLPGGKKTKTGFSTGVDVLEDLAEFHPAPKLVLEYRKLAKLKNGYVDALPKMINPDTGRIHTSFNQTITATGRLSSSDPNLQNIPIRTELGRKIRRTFIAPPGHKIVSADYSQIELRLLAHYSGEKALLDAFNNGDDIHTLTAAEIFNVVPQLVTTDMRRVAKTVNFGVIYGQTAFGLARGLKIPQSEARKYINGYFEKYPGIREYIDRVVKDAKDKGYVTTLLGRKRRLPDIKSKNRQARQFAERNAVNTPMQGSAADLIKKAMITIHHRLKDEGFASKMILQVHDELVFETPEAEVDRLIEMVRHEMENVWKLDVPLVVDVNAADNWEEAH